LTSKKSPPILLPSNAIPYKGIRSVPGVVALVIDHLLKLCNSSLASKRNSGIKVCNDIFMWMHGNIILGQPNHQAHGFFLVSYYGGWLVKHYGVKVGYTRKINHFTLFFLPLLVDDLLPYEKSLPLLTG
jgi:hypothetical protein